nr:nucleotidyltransferase domain-containing protein [Mycobacterium kansasii]
MELARYPAYTAYDRPTFDELPAHWDVVRGRHLVRIRTGSGDTVDAVPNGAYPFYVRSDAPLRSDRWEFDTTAVLTAGDGAGVAKVFHLVYGRFMAHQRVYVLDGFGRVTPRFFYFAFSSAFHLMALDGSARSTVDSVRRAMIADMPFPVPPLDEQLAITDYLARETARIDTLIDEQQRLIEMLRERRNATATSELGARVGIGERLKWCLVELDIRASEVAAVLPLMSVSIDWGVRRRDEVTGDEARAADLSNYKVCRRGDLVINRMRAFQEALGLAPEDGIVSPDCAVLRPAPQIDGEWLAAAMKTDRFVSEMSSRIKGIGSADLGSARTPRINIRDLCDIRLDIPEAEVQANEIGRLRRATEDIDTLIAETERFIELARERRSALITAAVTGQIDVSGTCRLMLALLRTWATALSTPARAVRQNMQVEVIAVHEVVESKRHQIQELCRQLSVRRLDVFGSAVSDSFDIDTSDVDVLVEFEAGPDFDHYFALKEGLEKIIGRPVDVVTLSGLANPYFKQRVMQTREPIYAA